MRLTVDVVLNAHSSLNAVRDRELSLRGLGISILENLQVTKDLNDTIDLTDNEILALTGIPKGFKRLKTLLLSNNSIASVDSHLSESCPNLESLILTNNRLENLADLDFLRGLKHLKSLSLLNNPVSREKGYRKYVISLIPHVRFIDFTRVKESERHSADINTEDLQKETADSIEVESLAESNEIVVEETTAEVESTEVKEARKRQLRKLLAEAKTIDEIEQIESQISSLQK